MNTFWTRPSSALLAWGVFVFVLASLLPPLAGASSGKSRSEELLSRIDKLWRGDSSHGLMTMHVKTKNYERTMTMEVWSVGKDKSLVRIVDPVKERGTATLKSEKNIYTYLPKTDRTIRLTSGMMSGSWMGSHFTNDDLVKESYLEDDFDSSITFEGKRGGIEVVEISLKPKPDAAVVWGKVDLVVTADDLMPVTEVFYNEDGEKVRTMVFSDIKSMGGRKFPANMKVIPEDKPDEFTELVYHKMEFDVKLDDSLFSVTQLRRM